MQAQQPTRPSYDIFLHRYLDNQQAKSVTFMRLQSHSTLYRDGVQNKYLTNLVIAGRNYIEVLAIFQNNITLSMGTWPIYEDILQVQQWDKNIVISTKNKIVGLVYEDCIIKNSFMLSLEFLELGYRQYIQTICDKIGFYMIVATSRQILLCISQKAIHKYKAKPFPHLKCSIIQQDIKWNRPQFQSISDVLKFQFYDYQLSKVESFHFCDQYLYFIGYNEKSNVEKHFYEMPIFEVFSDNERQPLLLKFIRVQPEVKLSYPIRKEHETQFIKIKMDNSIYLSNQKGEFAIENQLYNTGNKQSGDLICKKSNNPNIFPLHIFFKNALHIYERPPITGLSLSSNFTKRIVKLPEQIEVQYCDIQDNLFAYCNLYEVGLIYLRGSHISTSTNIGSQGQSQSMTMIDENQEQKDSPLIKIILKQSIGNIVDFNMGQNLLILENTFKNKCRLRLLKKSIIEHPKPFIMHPKKMALEAINQVKTIRSLEDLLHEYEMVEPESQITKVRSILLNYLAIQTKTEGNSLYRLIENHKYQAIFSNFQYYTLIKNTDYSINQRTSDNKLENNKWYLIFWFSDNSLSFYELCVNTESPNLKLVKKIENVELWRNKNTPPYLIKIKDYLISVYEQEAQLSVYEWRSSNISSIKLTNGAKDKKSTMIEISHKSITFKKKDKDFMFLEVLMILDRKKLQIWEVSVDSGLFKLSHETENLGQGLPILFPKQSAYLNININLASHEYRAITCPEYVLTDKTLQNSLHKSPHILKMHILQYHGQTFLFMINSLQQLQVYKKQYCTSTSIRQIPVFGSVDTGYLYHRQSLQLSVIKKFKYNEQTAFMEIGCGILRICNLVFFKGQIFEFPESIRSCFEMEGEIWSILNDSKIKLLITEGKVISHFLVTDIPCWIKQQMVGIQATNQNYVVYSKNGFEVFDKQLRSTWKFNPNDSVIQNKESILTLCAYDHYVAMSYYNYCEDESKRQYQSIKFKIRIYNTITQKKILEKDSSFEQPVLHMRYAGSDKLILVTSSNVSVNVIKSNQTLENYKNKHYSKRGMISSFSYMNEKVGNDKILSEIWYMLFGGLYGGLSFYAGQWVEKDKFDQICFENLKCGINQVQIFRYGNEFQMLKALIADNSENIIILDLRPKNATKIADFHIGSTVNTIRKRSEIPYIASADGCIRMLLPIKLRDTDINFLDFQQQICKNIPLLGGFNNRDSRLLDQRQRTYKITSTGNVVDGELISSFLSLTEILKNMVYQNSNMELEDIKNQLLGSSLI